MEVISAVKVLISRAEPDHSGDANKMVEPTDEEVEACAEAYAMGYEYVPSEEGIRACLARFVEMRRRK